MEFAGVLMIAFSILAGLSIYVRDLTGLVGEIILYISTGMFGFIAYLLPPILFAYGILMIFYPNRPQVKNKTWLLFLLLLVIGAIFHAGSFDKQNYEHILINT